MEESFQYAKMIIDTLQNEGHEAYVVGGAVRDLILKKEVHDIDITTSASPDEIKSLFPKTIDVAIKHGTVVVRWQLRSFEVTSYRGSSLVDDLRRRDFTINAVALSKEGKLVDPFLGQRDIERKLVRGVDNPYERINEDPLRILRGIRFVSELSFTIEEKTWDVMKKQCAKINLVAIERIAGEFEKVCLGKNCQVAISYLQRLEIGRHVIFFTDISKAFETNELSEKLRLLKSLSEMWSLLLIVAGHPNPKNFLRRWKRSKKQIAEVDQIIEILPSILKKGYSVETLYLLGLKRLQMVERVRAALLDESPSLQVLTAAYQCLPIFSRKDIAINGSDILALLPAGERKQRIGKILDLVEKAVLFGNVANRKDAIIRWLREERHI